MNLGRFEDSVVQQVLGANRGVTLKLLGVSRTKMSRSPELDVELLDRVGSALKLYARIAVMIGPQGASRWLNETHRHLGGKRPSDLMATHLGHARVEGLVTALEDGTFP